MGRPKEKSKDARKPDTGEFVVRKSMVLIWLGQAAI